MANTHDRVTTGVLVGMAVRRMTQAQLAAALGVTQPAVSARLRGRTRWSVDDLDKLSELFGMRVADLVEPPLDAFAGTGTSGGPTAERVTRHEHVPAQRGSGTVLLLPLPARRWLVAAA